MKRCCVPFCSSIKRKNSHIAFHEFPSSPKLRAAWLRVVLRRGDEPGTLWNPADHSLVCSKHFTKDDYSVSTKKKTLLPNVIPSVFPNYPICALEKSPSKSMPSISTNEKLSVTRKCIKEQHFETFVVIESETDVNQPEKDGDNQCQKQNAKYFKSFESKPVVPLTFSSKKTNTPTKIEKPFVIKNCIKENFKAFITKSETDVNQFEQNNGKQFQMQNANNIKIVETKSISPIAFSSKKMKSPVPITEETSAKKSCVKEQDFESSFAESKTDVNQFEQTGDIQCHMQNTSNLEISNTSEIIAGLQKQIEALKEENSNLCNIIISLNHKINQLQSQKKKVSKKENFKNSP